MPIMSAVTAGSLPNKRRIHKNQSPLRPAFGNQFMLDYDTVPIEYLRFPEPDVLVVVPTPAFPGTKGEIIYAAGFVYICVASNTWVRAPVETAWG